MMEQSTNSLIIPKRLVKRVPPRSGEGENVRKILTKKTQPNSKGLVPQPKPKPKSNNELIIEELKKMKEISFAQGKKWQTISYGKAIEAIESYGKEIQSGAEARKLDGIGKSIGEKIDEILREGQLNLEVRMKGEINYEDVKVINELVQINGIGMVGARYLVLEEGIRSVEELKHRTDLLNASQLKGLKYYEETATRIPREEMIQHELFLKKEIEKMDDYIEEFVIAGSYRRGSTTSGDIDVLIKEKIGPNPNNRKALLEGLIAKLKGVGYIVDDISSGKSKYFGYCRLPNESQNGPAKKTRRIDILWCSRSEYYFSLLYFTGSKSFNQKMRQMCLAQGLSLSEHGLVDDKTKEPLDPVINSERDIFDYLGFEYVEPYLRDDVGLLKRAIDGPVPLQRQRAQLIPKVQSQPKKTLVRIPQPPRIGSHIKIAGKVPLIDRIRSIEGMGGNAVQIYLSPSMSYVKPKGIQDEDAERIKEMVKERKLYLVVHGCNIYNWCRQFERDSREMEKMIAELEEANRIGADVVIHQGKNVKELELTREQALDAYIQNILKIINEMENQGFHNRLILENSARQGNELGYNLDDLEYINNRINRAGKSHYIGYCLDLCHIFTAGVLDVRKKEDVKEFFEDFNKRIGLNKLKVIHFNDSHSKWNQGNDEHADIGGGYIGDPQKGGSIEGFKEVCHWARRYKIPLILEINEKKQQIATPQQINLVKSWWDH